MSDVLVEERTCDKCGAEARHDTQFCYNCGESLEPAAIPPPNVSTPNIEKPKDVAASAMNAGSPMDTNGENASAAVEQNPKLTSAASLRRKGRVLERKSVEVFWEPAENRANLPLVIATIIFVIFTTVAVILALYYR